MNQTQRHEKIVGLIKLHGFMSIDDLVNACEVTPQTIRRDLNQLAEKGVVSRYHGGAGLNRSWENTPYQERKTQNSEVKEKIAEETYRDHKIDIHLHYFLCKHIANAIELKEHENIAWVKKKRFNQYDFAEGDGNILSLL